MVDAAFLIDHGVTNLIDVDGLLYAPVSDLWACFLRFIGECLLRAGCLFMIPLLIFGLSWLLPRLDVKYRKRDLDG